MWTRAMLTNLGGLRANGLRQGLLRGWLPASNLIFVAGLAALVCFAPLMIYWPLAASTAPGLPDFYVTPGLYLSDAALAAVLLLALGEFLLRRKRRTGRQAAMLFLPLLGLAALAIVFTLKAVSPVLAGYTALRWLLAAALFLALLNLDLRPALLAGLLLAAGVTQAGVGIAQVVHGGPLGLPFEPAYPWEAAQRAYGFTFNANVLGGVLAAALVVSLPLTRRLPGRIAWWLVALGLLLTFSRTAVLSAGIAVALLAGWSAWRLPEMRPPLAWTFGGAALAGVAAALVFSEPLVGRLAAMLNASADLAIISRGQMIQIALQGALQHPLAGIGAGAFPLWMAQFSTLESPRYVHNVALMLAAEVGLAGGLLWLWLWWAPAFLVEPHWQRRDPWPVAFALAWLAWGLASMWDSYPWALETGRIMSVLLLAGFAGAAQTGLQLEDRLLPAAGAVWRFVPRWPACVPGGAFLQRLSVQVRHWNWLPAALALLLPFGLYLLTVAPTIYNLDSAELTAAAASGGIVHPTGYPLYLLLGRLWTWLPVGDVGYRMNLFSALWGALTIFLAERIMRRLGVSGPARAGALGLLATAYFLWALSLIAEVYTLQTCLMAAWIWLLLRWVERPGSGRSLALGLATGLCLTHHAASLLFLPAGGLYAGALAWSQWRRAGSTAPGGDLYPDGPAAPSGRRRLWRSIGWGLFGLGLGLLPFLYLPLAFRAGPPINYAGRFDAAGAFWPYSLDTWQGFWIMVSARDFHGFLRLLPAAELGSQAVGFIANLWRAFFGIGVTVGLVGLLVFLRHDWKLALTFAGMFMTHVLFYLHYHIIDRETMYLPAYLIWAIWVGVGYDELLRFANHRLAPASAGVENPDRNPSWPLALLPAALVILPLAVNWSLVDLSSEWSTRWMAQNALDQSAPHALVVAAWQLAPTIEYLQIVEGQRPDVQVINRFLISPADLQVLLAREISRRPVYIDSPGLDAIPPGVRARQVGMLYQLVPGPAMQRSTAPAGQKFP